MRLLAPIVAAIAIAALALLRFHLPLTADDYGLLAAGLKGFGALWQMEGPLVARLPVGNGLSTVGIVLGLWEKCPSLFLLFYFAIHATAFVLLADWLRSKFAVGAEFLFLALLPQALFPNNHEVHLWYSVAAFQFGALAAAFGLRSRRDWARIVWFAIAFLSYETFVFLIIGAMALEWLADSRPPFRSAAQGAAALVLTFLVRAALAHVIGGTNQREMHFDLGSIVANLSWIWKAMIVLNFRKENWPIGSVEWLATAPLLFYEARRRPRLAIALFIPLFAATPVALLPYQATRALYGPNLLRAMILGVLLASFLGRIEIPRWLKAVPIALFALSYGYEWGHILSIKDANARVLAALDSDTRAKISACVAPCTLEVPRPDALTKDDWVIHHGYYPAFYERLRLEADPAKSVNFVIR